MIRGLEGVLASRKAFIDATASRDAVAHGATAAANVVAAPQKPALQQLVQKPEHGFVGLFNQGATWSVGTSTRSLDHCKNELARGAKLQMDSPLFLCPRCASVCMRACTAI